MTSHRTESGLSAQNNPRLASGMSVLEIKAPGTVEDSQKKFESFFTDLHKFYKVCGSEIDRTLSCEIVLRENFLHFYIISSDKLAPIIRSLLYTKFPDVEISNGDLPGQNLPEIVLLHEYGLKRSNYLPLKTSFQQSDNPYMSLSAVPSKLEHFNEGVVVQMVLFPTSESWIRQFIRENIHALVGLVNSFRRFIENPFLHKEGIDYNKAVEQKYTGSIFRANIRILAYANTRDRADENFALIEKSLEKYKNGDINALKKLPGSAEISLMDFTSRKISSPTMILNVSEAASIYHFPPPELEIASVYKVRAKKLEPPKDLPICKPWRTNGISAFGITNFRDRNEYFGIRDEDMVRHLYIIGKTGMGKSKMIELLAISDVCFNKGFCVIDPHGDLARNVLSFIPERRIPDVIYFDPADAEYPIGFNPLECHSPEAKHQVVTGFVGIFKKLFASNWTNRLEHMLRFIVLALVEAGDSTVVDIVRLLTDVEFRQSIVARVQDPVVKNFWTHEFASWNEKFDNEAIIPIINQVGQFISNDYIRNVVGQKKSAINFFEAMNEGKILVINLAKGKLGEDNSSLLGSMIVTKIQEATMARVDIPEHDREGFNLYVDEFQNFATEAFNQILSEARKFNLSVVIAHQFIDQLSNSIKKNVFGNIGSIVCFRVGSEDAHVLNREFAPSLEPSDLVNLDFREAYVKLSIRGKTSDPFSARTITIPKALNDLTGEIVEYTREHYAVQRNMVEEELWRDRSVMDLIAEAKGNEVPEAKLPGKDRGEGGDIMEDTEFDEPIV